MKKRKISVRRHEATDPNPISLPVKFRKPPTLAEQIARYMSDHKRHNEEEGTETREEADDHEVSDDESPYSPHELVYDEQLNRELTRYQKEHLDQQRAVFDAQLSQQIAEAKRARKAAEQALNDAKHQKPKKRVEQPELTGEDETE